MSIADIFKSDSLLWLIPAAFFMDLWIGDPVYRFHPVRIIGNLIIAPAEHLIRTLGGSGKKAGLVLVIATLTIAVGGILLINAMIRDYPGLYLLFNGFIIYSCIAVKDLKTHVVKVHQALVKDDIALARQRLSFIVGRQTKNLNKCQVAQACVETMAENLSDGIVAPLFFAFIGGAPLAVFYKAVNTMDSMVGYQNERYFFFGYFAAKLDDLVNWIPARITMVLILFAGSLLTSNRNNAWQIAYANRRKHKSPNSGYPEAAIAGIMNIRLGGPNYYHNQLVSKPYIHQNGDLVNIAHIKRVWQITFLAAIIGLAGFWGIRMLIFKPL